MKTAVGVFKSYDDAASALKRLGSVTTKDRLVLLAPGDWAKVTSLPKTEDMPPAGAGMGAALGGALGIGIAGVLFLPAVGAITAIGALAAVLLGLGGALAGGFAGKAADESLSGGVPADELFVYEDALRRGRFVVMALVDGDTEKAKARQILNECGAESVDAARDNWWVGLRKAEELEYSSRGGDFRKDEPRYQKGFTAALHLLVRGKSFKEAREYLRQLHGSLVDDPAFEQGYERGHEYALELEKHPVASAAHRGPPPLP